MKQGKQGAVKQFVVGLVKKQTKAQQKQNKASLKPFIIELVIFTALVLGYFFLVLVFLAGRLKGLFDYSKPIYALVALALMASQGVVLEVLSAALLKVVQAKMK